MRPIDADALIEKCGGWYVEEGTESGFIGTLKNLLATMPTIQPEKAQLLKEGTTSDLISRQAAIDIFDDYNIAVENGELEAYSRDRKRLCNLPTIQPQSTAGQLNDSAQSTNLIDRQAAIDALDKRFDNVPMELTAEILKLRKDLRELPTSQKKIVKCKDCRWWKKMKSSGQGRCKLLGIYPTGGWYCANGSMQKENT